MVGDGRREARRSWVLGNQSGDLSFVDGSGRTMLGAPGLAERSQDGSNDRCRVLVCSAKASVTTFSRVDEHGWSMLRRSLGKAGNSSMGRASERFVRCCQTT